MYRAVIASQNVFLIRFPRSNRHEPPRDRDRIEQHNTGNNIYIYILYDLITIICAYNYIQKNRLPS